MKISRVYIENFKRFDKFEVEIKNTVTNDIAQQYLFLGDNGMGKTTILQGIALCFSKAAGIIKDVSEFTWPGWVSGRYRTWGNPTIEIDVSFTPEEIQATVDAAKEWSETKDISPFVCPAEHTKLTLCLKNDWVEAKGENGEANMANLCQLKGRYYAMQLLKEKPAAREYFDKLPGLFWFDQFRNLETAHLHNADTEPNEQRNGAHTNSTQSYVSGLKEMRRYLVAWKTNQLQGATGAANWLEQIEAMYRKIFSDRSFSGLEPAGDELASAEHYFILEDGNRKRYDIAEMSAGEQSVFPMLFNFVRLGIKNSVVLIDEVDLNLHPNLAQALVTMLPQLCKDSQFLLTTHSRSIVDIFNPHRIHRIEGNSCL